MNIGAHSVVCSLSSTVQNVLRGLNIIALSVVLELRLCDVLRLHIEERGFRDEYRITVCVLKSEYSILTIMLLVAVEGGG